MVRAVRLAAVTYNTGFRIDDFLSEIVNLLRAERVKLGGTIQRNTPGRATACSAMVLEDIASRDWIYISQELGPQAHGCRLDPHGLADIGARLERTVSLGVDELELLILNKFGKAEAEGAGLRSSITRAIEAEIPVLTSVRPPYTAAWAEFHAGLAVELQPEGRLVLAWCRDSVKAFRSNRSKF